MKKSKAVRRRECFQRNPNGRGIGNKCENEREARQDKNKCAENKSKSAKRGQINKYLKRKLLAKHREWLWCCSHASCNRQMLFPVECSAPRSCASFFFRFYFLARSPSKGKQTNFRYVSEMLRCVLSERTYDVGRKRERGQFNADA